jgi:hypothetical protein
MDAKPDVPAIMTEPLSAGDPLDRLRARVLRDASLQERLWVPDDDGQFIALVREVARHCGYDLDAEALRVAMRGISDDTARCIPDTLPPGWLPIRTFWQGDQLYARWAYLGQHRLDQPFFEGNVQRCLFKPFNRLFNITTPITDIAAWLTTHPGLTPRGFVFHMSRCGSTLVSQMLAAVERNTVVSEAGPIDSVVQARLTRPDLTDEEHAQWLTWMVGALGQPFGGARDTFIKLDTWHTVALPLFRRAFPAVPWVFLYRDPVEVVVSHLKIRGMQTVPGLLDPNVIGVDAAYQPQRTEDHIARVLAAICEPVIRHVEETGGLLVDYNELPDAVWTKILPHFGVDCSDGDRDAMMRAPGFNAKTPGFAFTRDVETKQQAATAAVRTAVDLHLGALYRQLEALRTRA